MCLNRDELNEGIGWRYRGGWRHLPGGKFRVPECGGHGKERTAREQYRSPQKRPTGQHTRPPRTERNGPYSSERQAATSSLSVIARKLAAATDRITQGASY